MCRSFGSARVLHHAIQRDELRHDDPSHCVHGNASRLAADFNAPSLGVVRSLGFRQVGTQADEVDGLELVFVIEPSSS
jgi:hypothetical protein